MSSENATSLAAEVPTTRRPHTQIADAAMMEKIEARARAFKTARKSFYEPTVAYDRLTPMMQAFLAKIGERIVKACNISMEEEHRRNNVLATMPRNDPGYDAIARDFELERVRDSKIIEKLLAERDRKVAKHTRFAKYIPPPQFSEDHPDDNVWVRAVVSHAATLGIDTTREEEYELLFLAAESLECPVPPNYEVHRVAAEDEKQGRHSRKSDSSVSSSYTSKASKDSWRLGQRAPPKLTRPIPLSERTGGAPVTAGPRAHVFYYNKGSGQSAWDHPLDGYYRSIVAQRKLVRSLEKQGRYEPIPRVWEAEETMRDIILKNLNPRHSKGGSGSQVKRAGDLGQAATIGGTTQRIPTRPGGNKEGGGGGVGEQSRGSRGDKMDSTRRDGPRAMYYQESLDLPRFLGGPRRRRRRPGEKSLPRLKPSKLGLELVDEGAASAGGAFVSGEGHNLTGHYLPAGKTPVNGGKSDGNQAVFVWSADEEVQRKAWRARSKVLEAQAAEKERLEGLRRVVEKDLQTKKKLQRQRAHGSIASQEVENRSMDRSTATFQSANTARASARHSWIESDRGAASVSDDRCVSANAQEAEKDCGYDEDENISNADSHNEDKEQFDVDGGGSVLSYEDYESDSNDPEEDENLEEDEYMTALARGRHRQRDHNRPQSPLISQAYSPMSRAVPENF